MIGIPVTVARVLASLRCNFADRHGRETIATEYPMTSSNTYDPTGAGSSDDLRGLEILLVEDSGIVGEAIKDLLELLGADVVGPAATTAEAERLLSEHAPDVALVDFHLRGGELSYGLIARLHEQGVSVIMISGSSESASLSAGGGRDHPGETLQRSTASRELAPAAYTERASVRGFSAQADPTLGPCRPTLMAESLHAISNPRHALKEARPMATWLDVENSI